jgi:DNA-binding response OmpR family regulator
MGPFKILFVEDDHIASMINCSVLRDHGYDILEAFSASEAKNIMAGEDALDALITDIELGPGEDGFEVSREARRRWPDIPVIYVSGTARLQFASEGVSGAEFISKPFMPEGVIEALERILGRNGPQAAGLRTAAG